MLLVFGSIKLDLSFDCARKKRLPTALLRQLAVLIVNATELHLTAQAAGVAGDDLPRRLSALADGHALTVLVTLGRLGVMARAAGRTLHLPALAVPIRDTTGVNHGAGGSWRVKPRGPRFP